MKSAAHIIIFLIVLAASPAYSREYFQKDSSAANVTILQDSLRPVTRQLNMDSLGMKLDSLKTMHADSIVIDSVRFRFIPGMGQLVSEVDTESVLHQKQILWSDAKNIGDLTWKIPGFFYRDLGEAGKWGQLNAFGMDGRYIGILLDGRPMNDPVTGTYNISDLPLEYFDHIETLSGLASMPVSNASGVALNFVSRSYNSVRPATKIRFVQDPKETILTDGFYSQNVARGLNLMIGVMRQTSVGNYPQIDIYNRINPTLDAWNISTRLRYNLSDRFNILLSDFYLKAENGLNGGIDMESSTNIFSETGAIIKNKTQHDSRSRHDITLSALVRILSDSSSSTQVNFYYSALEREFWNSSDLIKIDDSTRASYWGIRLQQQLLLYPVHIALGGNWERRQIDSTRTLPFHIDSENSLFVQAELRLIDFFTPSVSLRSTSLDGESVISKAVGIKSAVADWITLFTDGSWSDRFPTMQERYWKDSTIIRPGRIQKEQHSFLQGGVNIKAGSAFQMSLVGFQREVKNAIVFQPAVTAYGSSAIKIFNVSKVKSSGINGNLMFRWNHFEVYGVMTLTRYVQSDTLKTFMPDVILSGELCYRDTFFKDKLDAKFGVRSRFYNPQQGMQFDPQSLSYIQYKTDFLGRSTILDLFMILKIGDAHLSLSWNNILDAGYMFAPVYPMPGRNVRLGVNWVFLD